MAQQSQMSSELFKKGDIVKLHGLKSKKKWNNKLANVIGDFDSKSKRYPVELRNKEKNQALIKPTNMKMETYGEAWKIDGKSKLQELNMLLKSYTRDLEAFAKLTARNKEIFSPDFEYIMHENIVCKSLTQFDAKLSVLKNNIIRISESTHESVPKLLNDKTSVLALNDDLTHFEITVEIDLHDNNKFWRRVSQVKLSGKEGLIKSAQVTSIQIIDKSDKSSKSTKSGESNSASEASKSPNGEKCDDASACSKASDAAAAAATDSTATSATTASDATNADADEKES